MSPGSSPNCGFATAYRPSSSPTKPASFRPANRSGTDPNLAPSRSATSSCAWRSGGEQSSVERLGDGGSTVADAELGVDVQQVSLDRGLADEQPGGRLPVGGPGRYQFKDLEFSLAGLLAVFPDHHGGDRLRALNVRDVEALDAFGQVGQAERFLQFFLDGPGVGLEHAKALIVGLS